MKPRAGVLPYKANRCDNEDGKILGMPCPVQDWNTLREIGIPLTDLDHKDGNHHNNVPDNVQELCPICHRIKGKQNNDHQNGRYPKPLS
jgi:5-methylcytosine-specific restriction endonuclease McrA